MSTGTNSTNNFKTLTDGFHDRKLEGDFRDWAFDSDKTMVKGLLLLSIISFALYFIADLHLNEINVSFITFSLLRLITIIFLLFAYFRINLPITSRYFDQLVAGLFIMVLSFELYVIYILPKDFLVQIGTDVILIFICYVGNTIPSLYRLVLASLFSAGNISIFVLIKEAPNQVVFIGYILTILIANLLGYWVCVRYGRVRRLSFLSIRSEKKLREDMKVLKGIIPICSYCKCILNNEGDWSGLESYIDQHSEAEFSHGICPECSQKELATQKAKGLLKPN